ncbi:MAG: PBP1A family penicillin-binding protein, partial [Vallitaleaceae bacterium]|nr:PBP1A family penicillin-binding protein [Vallitaleaceae bacterium]
VTILKVFVFSVVLGSIVLAGAGLGVAKAVIDSAPTIDSIDALIPKGYTSTIYDLNGNAIQELHTSESNRIYVEIDQIPLDLQNAIVAIEDERFFEHNGIDMRAMMRALVINIQAGGIEEGASPITQQVIKNNILSTEKSYERKIQEQYLALQVEQLTDKLTILELYLNTAPFGRGTLGVQAAANTYFNKDVSDLSLAECAVIAGITNLPTYYDPVTNPENSRSRQLDILGEMLDQGMITRAQFNNAKIEPVYSTIQTNSIAIADQSDYSYYVDEVITRVANDLKIQEGYTETQAFNLIYGGGLSIYIPQDLEMQKIVDEAYINEENFPTNSFAVRVMYTCSVDTPSGVEHHYDVTEFPSQEEADAHIQELKAQWVLPGSVIAAEKSLFILQPQSAFVIMDYYNGYVKAIAGGRGEKIGNQTFNRATQAYRQPGSTFKVIAAYLPAIDTYGFTLATIIDDVPYEVIIAGSGSYMPSNWYDYQDYNYRGLSTVKVAIKDSMNICAVKTLFAAGTESSFEYLISLGFTTLVGDVDANGNTDKTMSLALGGLTKGVSVLELTAAFGAIANQGVYTEPIFYTKVLDHDGAFLIRNESEHHTVMKETTAFLLTDAMQTVVSRGTGTPANFDGMHIAGKTGTTSKNIDYTFVGFTPYYVAGVWMGFDQPKSMPGLSTHKTLWKTIMEQVHENLEDKSFPRPDGIVSATICTESGKLATDLCSLDPRGATVDTYYFASGTVPSESCDVHVEATICTASGLFATEYCPPETLVQQVFIVRPEPLVPESWDPADMPRIEDYQYELPTSMIGEYCDVHGPDFVEPNTELPGNNHSNNVDPNNPNNPNN